MRSSISPVIFLCIFMHIIDFFTIVMRESQLICRSFIFSKHKMTPASKEYQFDFNLVSSLFQLIGIKKVKKTSFSKTYDPDSCDLEFVLS